MCSNCYNGNQRNAHTSLELQSCYNIHKPQYVSGLTGPSSRSAQLYKTIRCLHHNARNGKCKKMCLTQYLNIRPIGFCDITRFSHDPFKNYFVMHFSPSDSCLATVYSNSNSCPFLAHMHPCKAPTKITLSIHMHMITYEWLNRPSRSKTSVNFIKICDATSTATVINADINKLYLVQISGLWGSSVLHTHCSYSYIKTAGHCSRHCCKLVHKVSTVTFNTTCTVQEINDQHDQIKTKREGK